MIGFRIGKKILRVALWKLSYKIRFSSNVPGI